MLTRREKPRRFGIRFKFAVLIGALLLVLIAVTLTLMRRAGLIAEGDLKLED